MDFPVERVLVCLGLLMLGVVVGGRDGVTGTDPQRTEWRDPTTGMEFVWVPGGTFEMGCGDWNGKCGQDELPLHKVQLDGFWIGKYEVTQQQWVAVVGYNPSPHQDHRDLPVEMLDWENAREFLLALNGKGQEKFRLPTEAEWEYACRSGGKAEEFSGGRNVNELAWFIENSEDRTRRVGSKSPNGLGLYDMSGNVTEWLQDGYDKDFYKELAALERNPANRMVFQSGRVRRGGSWDSPANEVRCSARNVGFPNDRYANGLRLVRFGAPPGPPPVVAVRDTTAEGRESRTKDAPRSGEQLALVDADQQLRPIDITLTLAQEMVLRQTPSTTGKRVGVLHPGERVRGIGQVPGQDWVLVERDGTPLGYVNAAVSPSAP